jgi:hypothetical protein
MQEYLPAQTNHHNAKRSGGEGRLIQLKLANFLSTLLKAYQSRADCANTNRLASLPGREKARRRVGKLV